MNAKIIPLSLQEKLQAVVQEYPKVPKIVQLIHAQGGRALIVGGAVRDLLLGFEVKDLDIEVHGLPLEKLEDILHMFGPVSLIGKSFGVLRLHGLDVDWSLPRSDSSGRKPIVTIDPNMSMKDAFARRDLTINAMGIDLITFELIDPFNGTQDIENKVLRAPDAQLFVEDPLRFYRVMQFVGRFEMTPDAQLNDICSKMDISTISRERIEGEFEKLLLKSKRPSLGIRWLHDLKRLAEVAPEIAVLAQTPQELSWHPEGDVLEHSMQALDASVNIKGYDTFHTLILRYAAWCHDIGKPQATCLIDGKWKSPGHAECGARTAKIFLNRITHNVVLIDSVVKLVRWHMEPSQFVAGDATPAAYKRLAKKLAPEVTMQMLADLSRADKAGRNPDRYTPLPIVPSDIDEFLLRADTAQVREKSEESVLLGRDIIDVVKPGPLMGELLKKAYEIQIEEGIRDKEILRARVLADVKK